MQKLTFFSEYLTARYGTPLQRIPLDLALGCPHRANGGFGAGCIFCSEDGARARHLSRTGLAIPEQVRAGREYVARRYGNNGPYIAYFQSFTSTFAPVARLRELYETALSEADFKVVIVSTRPDALPVEVLGYLSELHERYELWVELGIQSACDATLAEIRRGHDFAAVREACAKLAARNIRIAGHFILGLPGETPADWRNTALAAAELPLSALKIHQLMVLKNTELSHRFGVNAHYVSPLNEYEYAAGLKDFLAVQPEGRLLMRLTAEAPDEALIAPRWWMKKGQFLEFFKQYFAGKTGEGGFVATVTADGTPTLYHPGYHQHFHSLAGAASEARLKFAEPSHLLARLQKGQTVRILDVGFGLGGNVRAALAAAREANFGCVEITSLELDLRTLRAAESLYPEGAPERRLFMDLLEKGEYREAKAVDKLLAGDARQSVRALTSHAFDLIWLDAFSPDANPELWTHQFFRELKRLLAPGGRIVTYSCGAEVRGAMLKNALFIAETPAFGRKRGGTAAALEPIADLPEITEKERHIILDSTAGTPYSDPTGKASGKEIIEHRRKLVERLRKHGIPKWYKKKV